jgi:hypothetical protein
MATVAISGTDILLRAPAYSAAARTIAGSRWIQAAGAWIVPASATNAQAILEKFEIDQGAAHLRALVIRLAPRTSERPPQQAVGVDPGGAAPAPVQSPAATPAASPTSTAGKPPLNPAGATVEAPAAGRPAAVDSVSALLESPPTANLMSGLWVTLPTVAPSPELLRGRSPLADPIDAALKLDLQPMPNPKVSPLLPIPAGFKFKPWSHQHEGYTFGMQALSKYNAVLLAAQMGVGKTLVATLLALGRGARTILVLCPLRVVPNWAREIEEYMDGPKIIVPLDRRETRRRAQQATEAAELARVTGRRLWVILNYDSFWRDEMVAFIAARQWDMIVYDESHRIKAPGGKASMFARRLRQRTKDVVLATGTPLAHSPLDIYGQFRAAAPGIFGTSYAAFKQKYAKMGGPDKKWVVGYDNTDDLERRMSPITWRCTKREALPDLPEEMDVEYSTEFDDEGARIYAEMERNLITEIEGGELTAQNALTKVLRLQQICGGAVPTDDGTYHVVDRSKYKLLVDVLEDLGPQPLIIFAQFRSDIEFCHEACAAAGLTSLEVSGQRDELRAWQEGKADVLVAQNQSGSVGINGTRAHTAIYYSLATSLVLYDQGRSRIHRATQKHNCLHIYLTVRRTMDQKILKGLRSRQDVMESIMSSVAARAFEPYRKEK